MTVNRTTKGRPPIQIRASEAERISNLALGAEARMPEVADLLLTEIERAKVVPDDRLPDDVVAMKSVVRFADEASGVERTLQVVYPPEADIEAGRVSILSLVGAGLLGLRTGQSINWPDRSGNNRLLRIIEVKQA